MQKLANNIKLKKDSIRLLFVFVWSLFFCSACDTHPIVKDDVDKLNDSAYALRYVNLESLRVISEKALQLSEKHNYKEGIVDALLNETFYHMARMDYAKADSLLTTAGAISSNDVSSLIIEIYYMRLCQRMSRNKDFYFHKSSADKYIENLRDRISSLSDKEKKQYTYARSEYAIVYSTYLYYVQLYDDSSTALLDLSHDSDIILLSDTAQYLAYLYNIGAGGILQNLSYEETLCKEFDYLMQCYMIAHHEGYLFWEANALQSLSEHINHSADLEIIKKNDPACLRYLNDDGVGDSLLSGNLAERSLLLFVRYGDVYQIAGARRTLSQCYKQIGDHEAELTCLLFAYEDSLIFQAPDLIASFDEKLSMAYSALDNKQMSDYHRNRYLDIQDSTRQDRQLEARIETLTTILDSTRMMMYSVIFLAVIMAVAIYSIIRHRKKYDYTDDHIKTLVPLNEWKSIKDKELIEYQDMLIESEEQKNLMFIQAEDSLRLNVEQHAKISLAQSILPLIDRMLHLVSTSQSINDENLSYISDVCDYIQNYNTSLTKWVQLRKGKITLHIETFPIQDVFSIIGAARQSFSSKGIMLHIDDSDINIKADKTLTLFMINSLIDNARKHTKEGGDIFVGIKQCSDYDSYVEISVEDTGSGMSSYQLEHLFDYRVIDNANEDLQKQKNHGFGLMNCRGIIESYKKTSEFFAHCAIFASSEIGKGTRISFRLPKAVKSLIVLFFLVFQYVGLFANVDKLNMFADSVYNANVSGNYSAAFIYADSCLSIYNKMYKEIKGVDANDTLTFISNGSDLRWRKKNLQIDYNTLLFIRNEMAVAALALHDWDVYENNNKTYTNLYNECSKDTTLNTYCYTIERTELQYNIYVLLVIVLIVGLVFIFCWFYLRELLFRKGSKRFLSGLYDMLLSDKRSENEVVNISTLDASLNKINEALSFLSDDNISLMASDLQNIGKETKQCIEEYKSQILDIKEKIQADTENIKVLTRERDKLYVANSLIDNTLSSLKHETMYFPSRIASIVDELKKDLENKQKIYELRDIVTYYRSLYSVLCMQCSRIEHDTIYQAQIISISSLGFDYDNDADTKYNIIVNKLLMDYLIVLVKKKNNRISPRVKVFKRDHRYIELHLYCSNIEIPENEVENLFTSLSFDVEYLIMKQILRETGSATNCHGSGIRAQKLPSGLLLVIVLPLAQV